MKTIALLRQAPCGLVAGLASAMSAAHVRDPSVAAPLEFGWSFEPWVVVPMLLSLTLFAVGYLRLRNRSLLGRPLHRRQGAAFAGGWLVLCVALMSPLDALSASLFSAHMVQHELLMIVAAPLLVIGRPLGTWMWALPQPVRQGLGHGLHRAGWRAFWHGLTLPVTAWTLHAVALWGWHVPRFFDAALQHPGLHTLQHASFLASALLFWWTVLDPQPGADRGGASMLSLFTTMVHTGALGALLTLAPGLWYPLYGEPTRALGFDPLTDQQLGGLVMWVPGGLAYLAGGLAVAARWLVRRGAIDRSPKVEAP